MNRRALVLAADSAVTTTRWEAGKKEERYFKGANKIFQLSAYQPVGLMIFDTADLQRVPWEIIAKEYRSHLGAGKRGRLLDYAHDFFSFIEGHKGFFPDDYRDSLVADAADTAMIRHLQMANLDPRVKAVEADDAAAGAARTTVLDEFHTSVQALPIRAPLTQSDLDDSLGSLRDRLVKEARTNLKMFGPANNFTPERLAELGLFSLYRRPNAFLSSTGLVIAGFCDEAFFPSYEEYECWGFVGQKLIFEKKQSYQITHQDSGYINAFGTTATVDTFTAGFGPDVFGYVRTHLRDLLHKVAVEVETEAGGKAPQTIAQISKFIEEHTDLWTNDVFEKHARPLRRVIGSLPVDEMASLAETLVMLESLKEKVTKPSESVGGPIDVAIMTKAEGFIWVKRKHFFDPQLNPRYFLRQRREHDAQFGED